MKYLAGLCLGFVIGIFFINFVLREHSIQYKEGYKAGNTKVMQDISKSYGITNIDSAIAKAKQMPSDSLNIIIFNLYATDEERTLVKQFAMWIKKIKEVKE